METTHIITNIYLRIFVGGLVISVGLAFIKMYCDRNKDNLWGEFYRMNGDDEKIIKLWKWEISDAKLLLYFGIGIVLMGLIGLLFGFRTRMVG